MANNRMVLVCNVCQPKDWQYHTRGVLVVSKWYPGEDQWWIGERSLENVNKFLGEHNHAELASEGYLKGAGQPNPVRLEYEIDQPPVLESNPKKGDK